MPRRKKVVVVDEVAAAGVPERRAERKRGIPSMVCLKGDLESMYHGESPWVCRCPLCSPSAWCAAVIPNGGICWHPRATLGDARLYPFCQRHYNMYVDRYPRPTEDTLASLRAWVVNQPGHDPDDGFSIPLHTDGEIYEARLARVDHEPDPQFAGEVRRKLLRILGDHDIGGVS